MIKRNSSDERREVMSKNNPMFSAKTRASVSIQKSFSAGELSPSLYARTDVAKYQTALKTCRNFYVMRHGGARKKKKKKILKKKKEKRLASLQI